MTKQDAALLGSTEASLLFVCAIVQAAIAIFYRSSYRYTTVMLSSYPPPQLLELLGDAANMLLFVSTAVVSYCMLYRFPNESYFDETWLQNGFCVANPESSFWNSHLLAFYSDTLMTVALAAAYYSYYCHQQAKEGKQSSSISLMKDPTDLQEALLLGSISGVFFHGVGHLYYGSIDPTGMDLKWHNNNIPQSIASQVVIVVALVGIFKGTLALASFQRIFLTAIAGSVGLTLLGVPPVMNFVYIQAIIYLSSAAHMLSLDKKHKQSAAYLIYPLLQFPVLAIGVVESTYCQQVLAPVGGHVVFDTAISAGALIAPLMASFLDARASSKTVSKKTA